VTDPATTRPPRAPRGAAAPHRIRTGSPFARLNAREAVLVERRVPAGPPPGPLLTISRLANGSRLWFAIAAVLALRPGLRRAAGEGVVAALLAAGGTQVVNHVVDRPRPAPQPALVPRPDSPSFPSSHTAVGVAFTTAVARRSPRIATALVPLAATLAYGRIRLRVHWPTDVLGGAALGVAAGRAAHHLRR
jgi:membrane-associated phospholipid phosphatase